MYDFVHHNLPRSFDDSFHYNYEIQNLHQTRQSGQLYIPRYFTFPDVNQISRANSHFLLSLTSGTNGRPRFLMDPECNLETKFISSQSLHNLTPLMSNAPTYIALNVVELSCQAFNLVLIWSN